MKRRHPRIQANPREQLAGFAQAQAQAMTLQLAHGRSEPRSVAGPLFDDQLTIVAEPAPEPTQEDLWSPC